jgi:hypothetical protein
VELVTALTYGVGVGHNGNDTPKALLGRGTLVRMTFADARGVEIMNEQIKQIAAALADPSSVAMPVLLEAVPDPETGQLVTKIRTPVSYEVTPDG